MRIVEKLDLTNFNSYRIKSICKKAFFPESEEDIRTLFNDTGKHRVILGSGHNIILSKNYYDKEFVIFSDNYSKFRINDTIIDAESGITMLELSKLALSRSLTGLEIFYDIPSSLGGAVVMNAGAGGEEIKDVLIKVRYYDPLNDHFVEVPKESIEFDYRNSFFQNNPHYIICSCLIELKKGNKKEIRGKMETTKALRWDKQPKDYPNAGSVFKRPKGFYVGPMIEELGLKGFSVGGAKISEKHAGFIVNENNATGDDIIKLINYVKTQVRERFGVELEVEQRIV